VAYLSLADLIAGPVRLSPAEAAALTLAVARTLDDEPSDGRQPRLPDDHGILLSSTGTIAFVRGPQAAAPDNRTALSALLMRLLRLEDGRPREHVPGGLLIVLARNLGYIQLPPTSPDAFRAALERFATSDPTLLAGIFWRAARIKGGVRQRGRTGGESARPPVERRRAGATCADLRRALRDVERELFDTRLRLLNRPTAPRRQSPLPAQLSTLGMLRWGGLAAAVVLLASIAAGGGTRTAPQDVELAAAATDEVTPEVAAPRVLPVREPSERRASASRRTSPALSARASAAQPRPPRRERRAAAREAAARHFAGGARQITWLQQR
jgi:hypothetical protein